MKSIRGAITVENNNKDEILKATEALLEAIISTNRLELEQIISIIFSATNDLDAAYPAVAARTLAITEASLLCVQEMNVENSLRKCIRILMHVDSQLKQSEMLHVYLKDAAVLRPDISHGRGD